MERYIIRFLRPGATEDEQIEVESFAIWREDAGFRSEHLLIDEGKELEAAWFGPWRVYADERGITSVTELSIVKPGGT